MHSFSACEEAIVNLLSLDIAVNHDGKFFINTFKRIFKHFIDFIGSVYGLPNITPPEHENLEYAAVIDDDDPEVENIENISPAGTSTPRISPRNYSRKEKAAEPAKLLEQQTEYLKQITANSEQCAKYARKQFHLEEDKFRFKKEYLLREEKRKQSELEYQLAMIACKKRKLDLLEASAA